MELFKVTRPHYKKKIYESKELFERNWRNNIRYAKYGDVVAYELDWKEQEWRCIRRINNITGLNYYSK